jgi:hypothetical protein
MNEPVWSCSEGDGVYVVEAVARDGMIKYYVSHAISKRQMDNSIDQASMLEPCIEGMMNEFRKWAFKSAGGNHFTGWPKQKYDNNSITCIQS